MSTEQSKDSPFLPLDHLERVEGWGGAVEGTGYVFRPSTVAELKKVFDLAERANRTITFRGSGRSYGDAALGRENIVLELTRLNRILDWDPHTGIVTVEPGVTIKQLWQYTIEDGWWPPVVPGTMHPTIGGCLAMNIHGKNNFKAGPIGDHVLRFSFFAPSGEELDVDREKNPELFNAIVGSFGMLGCFTSITLQLKKVYSGDVEVEALIANNLDELFEIYERRIPESDYLVGWLDAFARGATLGRSIVHQANYLPPGADTQPAQTLRIEHQDLPDNILGVFPKSVLWIFMKPFVNDTGSALINFLKFKSSALAPKGKKFKQSHAGFAFLLDYVPNWKRSYGKGGLIQFQSFIPKETAKAAFRQQLQLCLNEGIVPYLAVFKRHRPDRYLMTHAVDGFSLALDFKITPKNRDKIWKFTQRLNEIVLKAGGRFYFAKDATLTSEAFRQFLGEETIAKFLALKKRFDPENRLESALSKRLFAS